MEIDRPGLPLGERHVDGRARPLPRADHQRVRPRVEPDPRRRIARREGLPIEDHVDPRRAPGERHLRDARVERCAERRRFLPRLAPLVRLARAHPERRHAPDDVARFDEPRRFDEEVPRLERGHGGARDPIRLERAIERLLRLPLPVKLARFAVGDARGLDLLLRRRSGEPSARAAVGSANANAHADAKTKRGCTRRKLFDPVIVVGGRARRLVRGARRRSPRAARGRRRARRLGDSGAVRGRHVAHRFGRHE